MFRVCASTTTENPPLPTRVALPVYNRKWHATHLPGFSITNFNKRPLLTLVGVIDYSQSRRAIRRSYPALAQFWFCFEFIRAESRQYLDWAGALASPTISLGARADVGQMTLAQSTLLLRE